MKIPLLALLLFFAGLFPAFSQDVKTADAADKPSLTWVAL